MASGSDRPEREYSYEFRVAFWVVVAFAVISFALWVSLPEGHRAVEALERTWPMLLTGFAGMVFAKLA